MNEVLFFISIILNFVFVTLTYKLLFVPNREDFVQEAMKTLFSLTPRICLGSMAAYLVSNNLDIFLYEKIKNFSPDNRFIWLRNNVATMTSQLFDTLIFTSISFWGIFSPLIVWELCITTYLLKILIAICDTPFLYIANCINSYKK